MNPRWVLMFLAAAYALGSCSGNSGPLTLVVADQTTDNPPRDVIEVVVDEGTPLYPASAAGGDAIEVGDWVAGSTIDVRLWSDADEEAEHRFTVDVPADLEPGTPLAIVLEIDDDTVALIARSAGVEVSQERDNPIRAAAEAAAAEAAAAEREAEAAATEAAERERARVEELRIEARALRGKMASHLGDLYEVIDTHNEVYGEDNWAQFTEIARQYRNYTREAIDDLNDDFDPGTYASPEVADLAAEWVRWWSYYLSIDGRYETAVRNNDSASADAARADEQELWNERDRLLDAVDDLAATPLPAVP